MMFGAGWELRAMSMSELMHVSERARRVEVFTGAGRRRTWPADEEAAIVAESYAPGRTVCGVARRHGLTPAQLFTCRPLLRHSRGAPASPGPLWGSRGRWTALWFGSDRIGREPAGDRGGDPGAEGGTVIGPTGAVRVLMATQPVDFRKGADGLAALVRETMGADPFSGAVYVFRAKRAVRVKLVFWDGTCLQRMI